MIKIEEAPMRVDYAGEQPALEIRDLVVAYGSTRAVDGLTLTVPCGSVFGFLGPNGSGKTTTIKALLGFRPIDGGRARVLGYDAATQNIEIRARVGFVSEVNSLYDYLTIPQISEFCRATNRRWNQAVVDRYLKMFDLPPKAKISHLSKGMKSQLAFSLAMGSEPDMLIMDEPTAGLDPMARHDLLSQLVGEVAAAGKTVFFSSHILSEVETVADWIGIIDKGKLVVSDELDNLKQTQKVLKLTYAELPPPAELQALRSHPSVVRLEQEGRTVRMVLRGDPDSLAQAARDRGQELRDVDVVRMNLEDIYLSYMEEGRRVR